MTGGIYRHYKGGIYEVIFVATHTETKEDLVIYWLISDIEALAAGKKVQNWARPVGMWDETVAVDDKNVRRFTLIAEDYPTYQANQRTDNGNEAA